MPHTFQQLVTSYFYYELRYEKYVSFEREKRKNQFSRLFRCRNRSRNFAITCNLFYLNVTNSLRSFCNILHYLLMRWDTASFLSLHWFYTLFILHLFYTWQPLKILDYDNLFCFQTYKYSCAVTALLKAGHHLHSLIKCFDIKAIKIGILYSRCR